MTSAAPFRQDVIGIRSDLLYAEDLEEARLMVIGRKGYLPVEGGAFLASSSSIVRLPLMRGGKPIFRTYCAFWKRENTNPCTAEFARLLQEQFTR